jgi:hypothetical protein
MIPRTTNINGQAALLTCRGASPRSRIVTAHINTGEIDRSDQIICHPTGQETASGVCVLVESPRRVPYNALLGFLHLLIRTA